MRLTPISVCNDTYQYSLCQWQPADSALGRLPSLTKKGTILSASPVSLTNIRLGTPITSPSFSTLISSLEAILPGITPLESSSNRPITFTFDYQLKSLIYYHTEEFTSAQALEVTVRGRVKTGFTIRERTFGTVIVEAEE